MIRLYVDSAQRSDAAPLLETGLVSGVTTNPLLIDRAGLAMGDLPALYRWAVDAGAQEVFLQAWGDDPPSLLDRAAWLRAIGSRVVVKYPCTAAGLSAAAEAARRGHETLVTAVYSIPQALLASAAGATYVAPYLGRMGDAGRQALADVAGMHRAVAGTGGHTRVLVASVRSLADVVRLAQDGLSCFTLSSTVLRQFFSEPLTEAAVQDFDAAVERIEGRHASA